MFILYFKKLKAMYNHALPHCLTLASDWLSPPGSALTNNQKEFGFAMQPALQRLLGKLNLTPAGLGRVDLLSIVPGAMLGTPGPYRASLAQIQIQDGVLAFQIKHSNC